MSETRMTDKLTIRLALRLAILYEETLIDAYRDRFTGKPDEDEEGVKTARANIAAFKRVQKRYGLVGKPPIEDREGYQLMSLTDLMKMKETKP